ncbi:hypothetical protein BOX15_Mlig018821g1 [Macrostomum lignano]|nr:hypothetical protein BOX15_Mlig018821g2 [Macrostomum lignano]PAA76543.1 hypothetical protein BOX15_Mlig018821g3 [Macrostomum lignano]PAA90126.1 hypothetical protein BOX15_Mlig018821g1 [Macrostomum lignano]
MAGKLSTDDLVHYKQVFDLIDTDQDGSISSKELGMLFNKLGIKEIGPESLEEMIEMVDRDRNGAIEFPEFLTMISRYRTQDEAKEIRDVFNAFDTNKDGQIDFEELKSMMKHIGENLTDEEVRQMIKAGDIDGDGLINFEEFTQLMGGKK